MARLDRFVVRLGERNPNFVEDLRAATGFIFDLLSKVVLIAAISYAGQYLNSLVLRGLSYVLSLVLALWINSSLNLAFQTHWLRRVQEADTVNRRLYGSIMIAVVISIGLISNFSDHIANLLVRASAHNAPLHPQKRIDRELEAAGLLRYGPPHEAQPSELDDQRALRDGASPRRRRRGGRRL